MTKVNNFMYRTALMESRNARKIHIDKTIGDIISIDRSIAIKVLNFLENNPSNGYATLANEMSNFLTKEECEKETVKELYRVSFSTQTSVIAGVQHVKEQVRSLRIGQFEEIDNTIRGLNLKKNKLLRKIGHAQNPSTTTDGVNEISLESHRDFIVPPLVQLTDNDNMGSNLSNEMQEKIRYASILIAHEQELKQAGIFLMDNVWYFGDSLGSRSWPFIDSINLMFFPGVGFNQRHSIGDKEGRIDTKDGIKGMFQALGLTIATEEQEKIRWGKILQDNAEQLASVGIIFSENIWHFGDIGGRAFLLKINDRTLGAFPNVAFLRQNKIIAISNNCTMGTENIRGMFQALGLTIATEEQEKIRWGKILQDNAEQLASVGIILKENIWHFGDKFNMGAFKNMQINGRGIISFPRGEFYKLHGINDKGYILKKGDIKKLFECLGLVFDEEILHIAYLRNNVKKQVEALITNQDPKIYYAQKIMDSATLLEKAGIIQEDGIWYFFDALGQGGWPKINGRHFSTFPSGVYNMSNKIGNTHGTIVSKEGLKELFRHFNLRVATEREEIQRKAKVLESYSENLKLIGIIQKGGVWHFGKVSGERTWPKIGAKNLRSFPSSEFNKSRGIGDSSGTISSPIQLKQMFEAVGLNVNEGLK